jgi:catechol-2,3-dioxygenase
MSGLLRAGPIPATGVSELVLEVLDLERAVTFYRDVLGFPVVAEREDRAWLMVGDRTRIGLWTPQVGLARGRGGVHVHYAMHVDEADFEACVEHLKACGPSPEVIDFEDDGRGRAAYVEDPDGNIVELWTWDVAGHLA